MESKKEIINLVNVLAASVLNDKEATTSAERWLEYCAKAKMCVHAAQKIIK